VHKFIIIVLLTISFNAIANEMDSQVELTTSLEKIRLTNDIPAMAVAIISSGEVIYSKGFGFLDEMKNKPTTSQSLFRIASISKLFTAQAIMQLVEQEKIKLDDNIGKYLPVFEKNKITIKQLLTHSSGLHDTVKPLGFDVRRSEKAYLDSVMQSQPQTNEDKTFDYSDTGFNVLGSVITAVTGVKYEKYIYNNILQPSGMQESNYFNGTNAFFADASPTYQGKLISKPEQRPYDVTFNPSEGLVANVHDLSRWLKLTLANHPSLLKKQSYQQMLIPQVKTSWGEIYMGLGWQVYKKDSENIARHPGSIRGYKSLILTYPESKNALILLTNSSDTPRWEIAKSITKILKENAEW